MTEKQKKVLEVITLHFKSETFIFSDLKQYGDFYPATLTSLVNLGLIEVRELNKKKVYKLISDYLDEETELQLAIRQTEGILSHLDNSQEYWTKQLEEVGIKFPEEEYQNWAGIIRAEAEKKMSQFRGELSKLEASQSAF